MKLLFTSLSNCMGLYSRFAFVLIFLILHPNIHGKLIKSSWNAEREVYVLDRDFVKHLVYGMDSLTALGYTLRDVEYVPSESLREYLDGVPLHEINSTLYQLYSKSALSLPSKHQHHAHRLDLEKDIVLYYGVFGKKFNFRYNSDSLRLPTGQGVSGSHSSMIGTMEALASYYSTSGKNTSLDPYEYYIWADGADDGVVTRNIHYVSRMSDEEAERVTILIMWSFTSLPEHAIQRCKNLKHVIQVGECLRIETPYDRCNYMVNTLGIRLHYVHLSQWDKKYALVNQNDKRMLDLIAPSDHHVIPNPVFWDLIDAIKAGKGFKHLVHSPRHDYIFHAVFERGGEAATRVFCGVKKDNPSMDTAKFYTSDYDVSDQLKVKHRCDGVTVIGSMSKSELYQKLSTTKYFLYLLVLPRSYVHKDTFANSVLEAIMLGVRVVTIPAATLPELYGRYGLVDFFPIDDPTIVQHIQDTNFETVEPHLNSEAFIDSCIKFIQELDKEDFTKERKRRMEVARAVYNPERFTELWANLVFNRAF